jgi:hypothetical protein
MSVSIHDTRCTLYGVPTLLLESRSHLSAYSQRESVAEVEVAKCSVTTVVVAELTLGEAAIEGVSSVVAVTGECTGAGETGVAASPEGAGEDVPADHDEFRARGMIASHTPRTPCFSRGCRGDRLPVDVGSGAARDAGDSAEAIGGGVTRPPPAG